MLVLTRQCKRQHLIIENKMSLEKEFTARFFSNDSIEKFDNTLSKFTVEFDQPVDFGGMEYEVGVSQLYLNTSTKTEKKLGSHDSIIFPIDRTSTYPGLTPVVTGISLDSFVDNIVEGALEPRLYTNEYFEKYLDENMFFDNETLNTLFPEDTPTSDMDKDLSDHQKIVYPIDFLLEPGEKIEQFVKQHTLGSNEVLYQYSHLVLFVPTDCTMTMRKLLNYLVRTVIMNLRNNLDKMSASLVVEHARRFFLKTDVFYKSRTNMQKARVSHLQKNNIIIHRFIKKFVSKVVDRVTEMRLPSLIQPRFLFLYCDAIKPQITGVRTTRLLYATPYEGSEYHEKVVNIQYFRIEKTSLKTISFAFLDETAESIDFVPSFHANFIELNFRRIF